MGKKKKLVKLIRDSFAERLHEWDIHGSSDLENEKRGIVLHEAGQSDKDTYWMIQHTNIGFDKEMSDFLYSMREKLRSRGKDDDVAKYIKRLEQEV